MRDRYTDADERNDNSGREWRITEVVQMLADQTRELMLRSKPTPTAPPRQRSPNDHT
jgi:hypothetical protein